jgi:hypothetical protein
MSEATLRRILPVARNNPDDPCPGQRLEVERSQRSLKSLMESMLRRLQEVLDREGWTTKY